MDEEPLGELRDDSDGSELGAFAAGLVGVCGSRGASAGVPRSVGAKSLVPPRTLPDLKTAGTSRIKLD